MICRKRSIMVLLILLVISAGLGCIKSTSSNKVKDILKMVPEDKEGFAYFNFKTIVEERGLYKMADDLIGGISEQIPKQEISNIDYIAGTSEVKLFEGRFNLKNVKGSLENEGFKKDIYKDIEIWKKDDKSVAIFNDNLSVGNDNNIRKQIEVVKGESKSMYDNDDIKDVVEKLPDGIYIIIRVRVGSRGEELGLIVAGQTLMKEDENTLKVKGVLKFVNEDSAKSSIAEVKNMLDGNRDRFDIDVNQNGKFVEYTAKARIENWKSLLIMR